MNPEALQCLKCKVRQGWHLAVVDIRQTQDQKVIRSELGEVQVQVKFLVFIGSKEVGKVPEPFDHQRIKVLAYAARRQRDIRRTRSHAGLALKDPAGFSRLVDISSGLRIRRGWTT